MSAHTHATVSLDLSGAGCLHAATEIPGLGIGFTRSPAGMVFAVVLLVVLFGTVFAAVHHAEVIAEVIGEPFGTLLLTMSVTIIEVALIATIMLGENGVPTLARDTVFAVVMIVCNGLVGICILVGGLRYREQDFQVTGANVYLSVLVVLATITLILPNYTETTPGPIYSASQLGFVSVVTIVLYGVFLYTQTVRHRDYFIAGADGDDQHHAARRHVDHQRDPVAGVAHRGRDAREEVLAGGGCRRRRHRRAACFRGRCGGAVDSSSGRHCRLGGRP
jgi:Ca2+:H+ antiporter